MQSSVLFKKSGLIAAFFLLLVRLASAGGIHSPEHINVTEINRIKAAAQNLQLHESPVWSALLHVNNRLPNIADPNFLLSLPNFSLASELQQTLDFLYLGDRANICRFPARYLWLRQQLNAPELPLDTCPDIVEFRQKAPLDNIALIFASESISQPASMLGHAFLKFSGSNEQGQEVSHAISFYTDADTINLPKLLFDSMVVGKRGYFSLEPYHEKQQLYVDIEQRNVWEYQLTLTDFQRELIRLHLLELKQIRLTYFFQKYNCATLLNFILALTGKPMSEDNWWITPKDLIKNAEQAELISSTRVITPSRWIVRALANQISISEQQSIREQIHQGTVTTYFDRASNESDFILLEFSQAYNQYAYLSGSVNKETWQKNNQSLTALGAESFSNKSLSVDNRYNPINTPGDSQVSLSALYDAGEAALALTFLPVSHTLNDDNRNYANESSLQLFSTTLKVPLYGGHPKLDKLVIYDMQSITPYNALTGGVSSRFHIAVEPHLNKQLTDNRSFVINGGLGYAKRIVSDIDLYALGGGGVAYAKKHGYFYSTLEVGAILREVWDMKSLVTLTRTDGQIDMGSHFYTAAFSQSKYLNRSNTLNVDWKLHFNDQYERSTISLTLKSIF